MGRTGSSNKKVRQRKPVGPQELTQMHQHAGKRSTTEVEHENASRPQHLVRIRKAQQKADLRVSMEDDDMFTMLQWSDKAMDQNEKSIDSEREEYQKTLRQDSLKKRTPISTRDIFGEDECCRLYDAARKRELQGYAAAFFGLHFRRVSNTFGASLLDSNSLATSNALRASLLSRSLTAGIEDEAS